MSVREKYQGVVDLAQEIGLQNGFVKEENGKLVIGGSVGTEYDLDRLQEKAKQLGAGASDIDLQVKAQNTNFYAQHTVVSGDTLSEISQTYLGDKMRYNEIFELNRDVLTDPDKIYPGQLLKIPKK
jgi:nucleoid-associated protein YgaU